MPTRWSRSHCTRSIAGTRGRVRGRGPSVPIRLGIHPSAHSRCSRASRSTMRCAVARNDRGKAFRLIGRSHLPSERRACTHVGLAPELERAEELSPPPNPGHDIARRVAPGLRRWQIQWSQLGAVRQRVRDAIPCNAGLPVWRSCEPITYAISRPRYARAHDAHKGARESPRVHGFAGSRVRGPQASALAGRHRESVEGVPCDSSTPTVAAELTFGAESGRLASGRRCPHR